MRKMNKLTTTHCLYWYTIKLFNTKPTCIVNNETYNVKELLLVI